MKYISNLILIVTFTLSTILFSGQKEQRDKYLSVGGGDSQNMSSDSITGTWIGIAEKLQFEKPVFIDGLTENQQQAIDDFIVGNLTIEQLDDFEAALKKHECFLKTDSYKDKNLTTVPSLHPFNFRSQSNLLYTWFKLDCDRKNEQNKNKKMAKKKAKKMKKSLKSNRGTLNVKGMKKTAEKRPSKAGCSNCTCRPK